MIVSIGSESDAGGALITGATGKNSVVDEIDVDVLSNGKTVGCAYNAGRIQRKRHTLHLITFQ